MDSINHLFDFFLPRFCTSCSNKLSVNKQFICSECLSKIKIAGQQLLETEFNRKFSEDKIITDFHSLFIFEKDKELQSIIHNIKYNENFRLGIYLGRMIGRELKDRILGWSPDLILPIPLHHLKKAERGFNQSYFLTKGISIECGILTKNNYIKRRRFTPSQTQLNLEQRKENMSGAFKVISGNKLRGKKIILVDDVITTGATISECGKVLLAEGAEKVFALSAAIAN